MAHRKNVKRIDPRYFLNETANRREEDPLEEVFGFSQKEKLVKKIKGVIAMIDKEGGSYGGRPVHDRIKEPFAIAIAKGGTPRTSPQEAIDLDIEKEELQALQQVYERGQYSAEASAASHEKEMRTMSQKHAAERDAQSRAADQRASAREGGASFKKLSSDFPGHKKTIIKAYKGGNPVQAQELAQELLDQAQGLERAVRNLPAPRFSRTTPAEGLAAIIKDLEYLKREAEIKIKQSGRKSTSKTGGYGSKATDKTRWYGE